MRIGAECGGTFTDVVVLDENGALRAIDKVFSTPDDPSRAVVNGLNGLAAGLTEGAALLHGSTVATNALLERRGARIGMLVTRGFRDLVFLQRQDRLRMYDLGYRKPVPLVRRGDIHEVDERLDHDGGVVRALDEESVRAAARALLDAGVTAIAVAYLHAYADPRHELRTREILAELAPDLPVSVSSGVVREFREYERTATTAADAFIRPVVAGYLDRLARTATAMGVESLQVMQSNGGIVPANVAGAHPVTMLLSGPAAGVSGAIGVAESAGVADVVTLDMGGTSTDVALVTGGEPHVTAETVVDGLPLRVPMVDITTVGAGGGSIVAIDSGGLLTVGPRSAGADPGPACYGRGSGLPTVTDANVLRGLIRPESFLGGRFALDRGAAADAFAPIAGRLGKPVERVAEDVYRLAGVAMAGAIRVASVERGQEVEGHTLIAYGGAGPLHAASVAGELGIARVLVPPYPGLASAYGLLTSGFRREFGRTALAAADDLADADLAATMGELADSGRDELVADGIDLAGARHTWAVDMRYAGQGFEVAVPVRRGDGAVRVADLVADFHELHRTRFGYADPAKRVQVVTLRLTVTKPRPPVVLPRVAHDPGRTGERRDIVEDGRTVTALFTHRAALPAGAEVTGPAVVEEDTSTCFVPSGWTAHVDELTNLVLERS
ncbi:MAG TPA: hydantoinase/oxoprolinase family protein [Streptosporangiaceae bacterium]|jgi:N-methylhydantoinase A